MTETLIHGYFRPKHKDAKIFESHLNPVMFVFMRQLSLSTLRSVPMCQVSVSICFSIIIFHLRYMLESVGCVSGNIFHTIVLGIHVALALLKTFQKKLIPKMYIVLSELPEERNV